MSQTDKISIGEPVRVLFLLDKLVPAGTQTNILEIVSSLDRKRFDPRIIALLGGGALEEKFIAVGVKPIVLNVKSAYGPSGWRALVFLIRYLRQERIEVLQTFFLHADILGTIAGRLAGVRRIFTTRRDEGFWRTARQVFVNRFLNRFVDAILVNSDAVVDAVKKQERATKPVHRIYNGVDTERFSPANVESRKRIRSELGLSERETAIVVVAHMKHEVKGHPYLLDAVAQITKTDFTDMSFPRKRESKAVDPRFRGDDTKRSDSFKVFLIGDGALRASLEARTKNLGIEDIVKFLGSRSNVTDTLSAMDIGCLPSVSEGFSNSVLEYMASGLPVVATRVGGNKEIISDGRDGYLVKPKDSTELGNRLLELIKDKDLRARFGNAGREKVVNDFSLQKMISQYENVYSSVRRKRVLHVIWSLDLGGAEQVVLNLVQNIDRQYFEPQVLCLNDKGRYADVLEKQGIKVFAMKKRPKFDASLTVRMVKFIKREQIDIIHTHLFTANLWGRIAALFAGVPVVITEHNQDVWKKPFHFFLDRVLMGVSKKMIFVSKMVEQFYECHLSSLNGKACVIYNGIDTARFSGDMNVIASPRGAKQSDSQILRRSAPQNDIERVILSPSPVILSEAKNLTGSRVNSAKDLCQIASAALGTMPRNDVVCELKKEFGLRNSEKVLGMVARLVPQKGHIYFLEALNLLRGKGHKVSGLIVGDGPIRDALHKYVYDHGLRGFVSFSGFRSDMENVYRVMDIFVLPSQYEGFPLVVLEAMASNVPVVATPVGGVVECLRDQENSLLVPFGDSKKLAEAMEKLLVDESLRARLTEAALREVQAKFSVGEMARQTENIYREVLRL